MAEILIGVAQVYAGAIVLGITLGFLILVLSLVVRGRRGGAYRRDDLK